MKKITKQFLFCALSLSALTFVSCDNEDDATGASTLEVNDGVVGTVTPDFVNGLTVNEGDEPTYTYTVTLNEPQSVDIHVQVMQTGGTAVEGEDFEFDHEVVIPAYSTTGTGTIEILNDDTVEVAENLTLSVGTISTANGTISSPSTITINIDNFVSDALDLTFHFDREFSGANGYTNTLCALESSLSGTGYDVDFIVYDEFGNDLAVYDAQTGACTEHLTMDLADYADGLYHITAYLWSNADLDLAMYEFPLVGSPEFNIPITVDYVRSGAITEGVYTQEAVNFFTSNTATDTENQVLDVVISTDAVTGYRTFTIQDTAGNISASGKVAKKFNHIRRNK